MREDLENMCKTLISESEFRLQNGMQSKALEQQQMNEDFRGKLAGRLDEMNTFQHEIKQECDSISAKAVENYTEYLSQHKSLAYSIKKLKLDFGKFGEEL